MSTPREQTEQLEDQILSPHAAKSAETRGRARPEPPCPIRTAFQRDRDRIIHCKAFRRLTYKTQVFIAPEADHYRTRLTHTLEVAQIARTIARALRLNEDLTEAIALGHDLGHTPFGHAGEAALQAAYREFDPSAHFHHAEQSLRVVELLERDGQGLNLTWEVRDGIRAHSKGMEDFPSYGTGVPMSADLAGTSPPATLEAWVVLYGDRIAYINHDIDDAVRAGLITADSLPADCISALGATHRDRITAMVGDIVTHSHGQPEVRMGDEVRQASDRLKDFLFERVYRLGADASQVERLVKSLFRFYMDHPHKVPGSSDAATHDRASLARLVCDYLAGMTDRFAAQQFQLHFMPRRWRGA